VVWLVPAASTLLVLAAGVVLAVSGADVAEPVGDALLNVVLALTLPVLGAVVLRRHPGNALGRLWCVSGLAAAVTLAAYLYAEVAVVTDPGSLPAGAAVAWLSTWVWVLGAVPLVTLGALLLPDGRLPSSRWRVLAVVDVLAIVLLAVANGLRPGELANHPTDNPLGVSGADAALDVLGGVGLLLFAVGALGGAASVGLRWRRGTPELRSRLAVPALVLALLAATVAIPADGALRTALDAAAVVELVVLLGALAVGLLRDELRSGQPAIARSLLSALLAGGLAVTYALGVTLLRPALPDAGAGLVATVVAALAVLPLHDRLRQVVERFVHGDRGDPLRALDRLGEQLDAAAAPEAALAAVADTVAASLRLPRVDVAVYRDGVEVTAASSAAGPAPSDRVPLVHRGEAVGALHVAPRGGERALDRRDRRLLEALARHAAATVAALRLAADLQASRERLVAAREEERRRLRRDLHDGLGPTLAGIGLGLDIARASRDPVQVARVLDELKQEAIGAVTDVRRLVDGLRPPTLDELGLVGALERHADRLRGARLDVVVDGAAVGPLPAAVEVAAYRIVLEALTNTVRHAEARRCSVALRLGDDLEVEVTDDGVGLPMTPRAGVGLTAMRERAAELGGTCAITPGPDGGTTVHARIPFQGG
jgi:signal transduction histidine kinase